MSISRRSPASTSRATRRSTWKAVSSVDRLSGQPEPAGRHRQAADLRDLRQHARHHAALQSPGADGEGKRRPHQVPGHRCSPTARHSATTTATINQYGGAVRASYEMSPGVKPFVEVGADTRMHDLQFDRNGYQRDSHCAHAEGRHHLRDHEDTDRRGFGRLPRAHYEDPRLQDLNGMVSDGSLIWAATGLTTATLTASSRGEEIGGRRRGPARCAAMSACRSTIRSGAG